jgi:hypothetical protein
VRSGSNLSLSHFAQEARQRQSKTFQTQVVTLSATLKKAQEMLKEEIEIGIGTRDEME